MPPKSKKAKVSEESGDAAYVDKRKRNNDVSIVSQNYIKNEKLFFRIGRQKIS